MASMVGGPQPAGMQMHRKPVPPHSAPQRRSPSQNQPQRYSPPSRGQQPSLPPALQQPLAQANQHSRSSSSGAYTPAQTSPYYVDPAQAPPSSYPAAQMNQHTARRTLSNATTSTSSSTLHRSGSTASAGQSSSYVALMRKQKATVWSDRSQYEDPRMIAQQRAAKRRAEREITGANPSVAGARTSTSTSTSLTGGVRSKIRHHGAPKAQQYAPTASLASGVPMRLSAREVDEDDSDDDYNARGSLHQRTGSGRSSLGSAGPLPGAPPAQPPAETSNGSTPPSDSPGQQRSSPAGEADPTPVPGQFQGNDYFGDNKRSGSGGSRGSTDRENSFGGVKGLPRRVKEGPPAATEEEMTRRGSVDERTTTMSGYSRLFIANPDMD